MAHNKSNKLLVSSRALLHGLKLHGTWLNAPPETGQMLDLKLDRLEEAAASVETARTTATMAKNRLTIADRALKSWLTKARLVVMLARGVRGSESWVHSDFANAKTKIPKAIDGRISLGRALVTFFARHPELGVPFAEVTAARGRAICERAAQSSEMLDLAKKDYLLMNQQRQLAENDLRNDVRKLTEWLRTHLDGSDKRWSDFGIAGSMRRGGNRLGRRPLRAIRFAHPAGDSRHIAAA
ncbi:MAG TPA: hypothetical protein VJ719_03120 [Chthoniobacterales bacterium]|nr:hypothetical protein [Chthoniobacterales bacterium]